MDNEIRKSLSIKMKPSIVKRARVRAVSSDKTLGEWVEEAVVEKATREEREEKELNNE